LDVVSKSSDLSDVLKKAVIELEEAETFILPVKLVWRKLIRSCPRNSVTHEQFIEALRNDERFKLFDGPDQFLKGYQKAAMSEHEMEKLGFFRGPRVMLKGRIPTRREVVAFLLRKADQMFETLKKAWDIRPEGDENTEDQLLEALAKAQRLQRELRTILDSQESGNAHIVTPPSDL